MFYSGKGKRSLRYRSQPLFLRVMNSRAWDRGSGSQMPVQPDAAGDLEEWGTGSLRAQDEPRMGPESSLPLSECQE